MVPNGTFGVPVASVTCSFPSNLPLTHSVPRIDRVGSGDTIGVQRLLRTLTAQTVPQVLCHSNLCQSGSGNIFSPLNKSSYGLWQVGSVMEAGLGLMATLSRCGGVYNVPWETPAPFPHCVPKSPACPQRCPHGGQAALPGHWDALPPECPQAGGGAAARNANLLITEYIAFPGNAVSMPTARRAGFLNPRDDIWARPLLWHLG